jgi:antitoxin CcdA
MRMSCGDKSVNKLFNMQAIKKPANVSINSDLLKKAKDMNINLSATLEAALIEQLRLQQQHQWKRENEKAIQAYNRFVEEHGVFSDGLRKF